MKDWFTLLIVAMIAPFVGIGISIWFIGIMLATLAWYPWLVIRHLWQHSEKVKTGI